MTTLQDFRDEFQRYRLIGERAMAQVSDDALNRRVTPGINSIAMLVRHVSGNLRSRFTDFLKSDGEKPWRNRDAEFEERDYARAEMGASWVEGWKILEEQLMGLTEADLQATVRIRNQPLTVHEALCRSLAHIAYHVGQITLLSRILSEGEWRWLSVPKGKSGEYNQNPTLEKRPGGA